MRNYPKGCRVIRVVDGTIEPVRKAVVACSVEDLRSGAGKSDVWLVVQPRGKLKWFLFHAGWLSHPKLIATGRDPDVLTMRAVLGAA